MKSGKLVYQRPSERATTLRNYNKRNFQLSRKAPIPSRILLQNSVKGAGPASDHLPRLHEKMQAVEGLRSESPAPMQWVTSSRSARKHASRAALRPSARSAPPALNLR
jgi:hypothetical protein